MASGATTPDNTDDSRPPEKSPVDSAKGGFFTVYKKGQGYYTRLGTALGAALIIVTTLIFAYNQLRVWPLLQTGSNVNTAAVAGILAVIALVMSALAWWLMNRPANAEFLIATDSEMKKVNWTSWKDLVGSTRVVIFFMFATAIFLFVIDILFGYLFHLMSVLRTSPFG